MWPVRGVDQSSCSFPWRLRKHADAGDEVTRVASLNDNRVANSVGWPPKSILATIFEDQRDCFSEVLAGFVPRTALTMRSWYLGAVRDEPVAVLLDDRGELVMHRPILPRRSNQACERRAWQARWPDETNKVSPGPRSAQRFKLSGFGPPHSCCKVAYQSCGPKSARAPS